MYVAIKIKNAKQHLQNISWKVHGIKALIDEAEILRESAVQRVRFPISAEP